MIQTPTHRVLTREEFDALTPDTAIELLCGEQRLPANVLGRCGTHLHVGRPMGNQVVGYLLSWIEARAMLRLKDRTGQ